MKRRDFITLLGGTAAAWPFAARAQAKVYAIGILETVPRAQNQANFAALLNGLRELGYVEGQNLHIDYRSADGQGERFPELVAELVRNRVDLIVTRGTPAARAAKAATTTVPIVMAAIGEPLGVGKRLLTVKISMRTMALPPGSRACVEIASSIPATSLTGAAIGCTAKDRAAASND